MSKSRQIARQAERNARPGVMIPTDPIAQMQLAITTPQIVELRAEYASLQRDYDALIDQFETFARVSELLQAADLAAYGAIQAARYAQRTKLADVLIAEGFRLRLASAFEAIDATQKARRWFTDENYARLCTMHEQLRIATIAGETGIDDQPPDQGAALRALAETYYGFGELMKNKRRPSVDARRYVLQRLAQMRDAAGDDDPRYVNWLKEIRDTINSRPAHELRFAEKDAVREWIDDQIATRQDLNRYLINAVSSYVTREKTPISG
jgi:hypothetical protein